MPDLDNPFYPSVVRGVQARAHQAGYALLLGDSGEDAAAEQNLVHTMAKQVDGVILCAPFSSDAQVARLAQATSLVLVNRRLRDVPAVLMDAAHGMRQVIDHLLSLGHRRCAFLGGPREAWSNRELLGKYVKDARGASVVSHIRLPTDLIVRATTAPPSRRQRRAG